MSLSIEVNVSGEVERIHFEKPLTEGAFYYKGIQINTVLTMYMYNYSKGSNIGTVLI